MCELFSEILQDEGYQTFCANGAQAALECLKEEAIDLLLSDIKMPEMDGFQLAAKVAESYPHIKIQLMSAYSSTGHENLVSPELHQQMLSKPVDPNKLLLRIKQLLN